MNTKQELYENVIKTGKHYREIGFHPEVDLHIHTTSSDGKFSIKEILKMAEEIGLSRIIITDHNTILLGHQLYTNLSRFFSFSVTVEIGSEIACKFLDPTTKKYIPMEILAYHVHPYKLQEFIDSYHFGYSQKIQESQLATLMEICRAKGLHFSPDLQVPNKMYATEVLCKDLIQWEENRDFFMNTCPIVWKSPKLFYKKFCADPKSDFYFDSTVGLPTYEATVDAILASGGIPIVAHPFLYLYQEKSEVELFLDTLFRTSKLKGVEVYHSDHSIEQREFLKDYVTKHELLFSGGTDFHSGPSTILGFGKEIAPLALKKDMFSWL